MRTDQFITALASDAGTLPRSPDRLWLPAAIGAVTVAAAVFLLALGPRPDLMAAFSAPRFLFKIAVTVATALAAFALIRRLARPGATLAGPMLALSAVPLLLAVGIAGELLATDTATWAMRAAGKNALVCLTAIPTIAIAPLAIALLVLRRGAPTRPAWTGAAAGLAAGALAATLYATHCTDDSPLFVAGWYGLAVLLTVLAGAVLGRLALRW